MASDNEKGMSLLVTLAVVVVGCLMASTMLHWAEEFARRYRLKRHIKQAAAGAPLLVQALPATVAIAAPANTPAVPQTAVLQAATE